MQKHLNAYARIRQQICFTRILTSMNELVSDLTNFPSISMGTSGYKCVCKSVLVSIPVSVPVCVSKMQASVYMHS